MRTTAIMNFKGGTGKTVSAINIAAELAARGKRVVLADADPQCNLTDFFGVLAQDGQSFYDLLTANHELYYGEWITPDVAPNISLIPASMDLIFADVRATRDNTARLTALRELAECMTEDDYADFLLIDCPAYFTAATSAAMIAADDVIIPIRVDGFSLSGMGELLRQIKGMRMYNPRLRIAGALITMDRVGTVISREAKQALSDSAVPVFSRTIRFAEAVTQSIAHKLPLLKIKSKYAQLAAEDYAAVVDEYLAGRVKYGPV